MPIGVRAVLNRRFLVFHLEEVFDEGAQIGALVQVIVEEVRKVPGVVTSTSRSADLKPKVFVHFTVNVRNESLWPSILPRIVEVIRDKASLSDVQVVVRAPVDSSIESWHAPLLQRLF
jgi:hypothetical protein